MQPRWKRAHIKVSVASIMTRLSKGPEAPVEAGAVEVVVVESRRTQEEAIIRRSSATESEPCTDSEPCTPQRDMGCDRANASLPRLPYCLARAGRACHLRCPACSRPRRNLLPTGGHS